MSQEQYASVPSGWSTTRLDRVATVSARIGWRALTAAEYQPTGYAFLATPNIKKPTIDFENVNYISKFRFDESPELKLQNGDVLLAKDGSTLGIVNIVTGLQQEATVNGSIALLRTDRMEPRFLRFTIASKIIQEHIESVKDGMGVPHLFQRDIKRFQLPLPPLDEQRRIADFLDAETARIDALLNSQQRLLSLLADRRAASVVCAVSGGHHTDRRPAKLPWLRTLPSHWKEARVGLLAQMGSGHTPSRSHPEWWVDCTIPWITTGEVKQIRSDRIDDLHLTREKISEVGLANSSAELHPKGTVFLCRTASAGYSGVMGTDMATSQDFVTWTCGPLLNPYFLLWCLRAMRPDLLGRLAMGSTHKTIYVPDLQMLRVPLPPLAEQTKVVESIRRENHRVDVLTDKVRRQGELLAERRQALITAAVTGQFDVSTASGRNVTDGVPTT
ncbi:restriction endonuclease subunit S [Streptomyces sp. IBSBF 3010]|uniref:restriction endonuclease subunit S n=1 Tax=Streptomyces sp. IBSBF 3010 TaxID=2903526 RepID=UPI002FDBD256